MSKTIDDYLDLKKLYPDHLLLCRLGSFYELYFDDAVIATRELNITLNHKKIAGKLIPSCGFPIQSLAIFSNKLLQRGFKIAIAEQCLDPKNPQKITRQISKILTPGTSVDDKFFDIEENILLAIVQKNDQLDLCFGNVLLGNFYLENITKSQINQYLEALNPAEILLDDKNLIDQKFHSQVTFYQPNADFKIDREIFKTLSTHNNLALLEIFNYVASIHNCEILKHFKIEQPHKQKYLKISAKTKQNLQLGEIIKIIDQTSCSIGKRFLQNAINRPLADAGQINHRLDSVEFLCSQSNVLSDLQNLVKNMPDLEKTIGKITILKNASIEDLSFILQALQTIAKISEILFWQKNSQKLPQKLVEINQELSCNFELINFLDNALSDCKIRNGFNPKMDNYQNRQKEIVREISALENEYKLAAKIKNIKIEFNNLLGFYFEIKHNLTNKINLPRDWQLIQNLQSSIRFSSTKLKNLQLEMADLGIKIKALETKILEDLTVKVLENLKEIKTNCKAIGALDMLLSFAIVATKNNYSKPIVTNQNQLEIIGGKHLISDQFVTNDCVLGEKKIWLLTGANMAGKSTFLRQNALIVLLAQSGCFVPAACAQIGVRKEIFTKMIISDNLSKNQSSFMVEMVEMADILNNADENSLVIIDELCQTTNGNDGEKIAFEIISQLLKSNKSLVLISTHQVELAKKCQNLKSVICKKIEKNHEVRDGIAEDSSALEIAKMLGITV